MQNNFKSHLIFTLLLAILVGILGRIIKENLQPLEAEYLIYSLTIGLGCYHGYFYPRF